MDKTWMTAEEAATYTGYSTDYFLREIVGAGLVYHPPKPAGRIYQRWRFRREWLDNFLQGRPVKQQEPRGRKPQPQYANFSADELNG